MMRHVAGGYPQRSLVIFVHDSLFNSEHLLTARVRKKVIQLGKKCSVLRRD